MEIVRGASGIGVAGAVERRNLVEHELQDGHTIVKIEHLHDKGG